MISPENAIRDDEKSLESAVHLVLGLGFSATTLFLVMVGLIVYL